MSWSQVAAAALMRRLRAVYRRDPQDDAWLVTVAELPGCHTYGRTLDQARERIREAVLLFLEPGQFEVTDDIRLPAEIERRLARARRLRDEAESVKSEAQKELVAAAASLKRSGISLRDSGDLLGLSRQRVQQLAARR